MILSGARQEDEKVYLYVRGTKGRKERITSISGDVGHKVAQDCRSMICKECPAFDINCNGSGYISQNGNVIERGSNRVISNKVCIIPESSIPYIGNDIESTPIY